MINPQQNPNMLTNGEIYILPFFGHGHLFPSMELCKRLSSRNYKTTLIISSNLSSSVPSSIRNHPLVEIAEITDAPAPPPKPEAAAFHHRHQQMGQSIESFLSARVDETNRPLCAVIDVMMSWSKEEFVKFGIRTAAFFTSGACSSAMEFGSWKAQARDMKPGEIRILPGLPEDMTLTYADINRQPPRPPPRPLEPPGNTADPSGPILRLPGSPNGRKFGPPMPGNRPLWLDDVSGSTAILINTCEELELPFINFLAKQIEKPVWGVGPLLPEQYWTSSGSVVHDREIRPNRHSNYSEEEVIQWLESKPRESVIYVSFGSEVGPTLNEHTQIADALAESNRPFIWVVQSNAGRPDPPPDLFGGKLGSDPFEGGYDPRGLVNKVGDRGLIIRGWAPQLMILSHPSTGGFVSHCGWNSTVEAIGRGVPFLAWPIRGDQFFDAKLVVNQLKVGYMVSKDDDLSQIAKEDIVEGIERLMRDEEVRKRAVELGRKFQGNFPASSEAALDDFCNFLILN